MSVTPLLTVHVVDQMHLDVTFRLPSCQLAVDYEVTDLPTVVRLTVYSGGEYAPGRCIGGLGQGSATIELPHALGERHLVDGACQPGMDLAGSTDCATGYTRN